MAISMKFTIAIVLALAITSTRAQNPEGSPSVGSSPALNNTAYVFQPANAPANMASTGGFSDKRMVTQWPALNGQGVAQTVFTLQPCALRPPHYHPYSSGLLYVIAASNLSVGFSLQNGTGYSNMITTGASALFPQGLIHYQQNLGCDTAQYTISYGTDNPGTQVAIPGLLGLPASVIEAALGNPNISSIMNALPTSDFIANSDPACMARCTGSGSSTAGK